MWQDWERIIAVPQDSGFFLGGGSIRDNLDPEKAASDSDCVEALQVVRLSEFLGDHGSIHSVMRENALSSGDKVLFNLARAVLRRRIKDETFGKGRHGGILLLDEINSNMDDETERIIHKVLVEESSQYTIVMVTHRVGMMIDFFNIVVMLDQAKGIKTGRPGDLVPQGGL
ncbi:hypothetical protein ACJZ2D_004933 [Fusarium nematophilum]